MLWNLLAAIPSDAAEIAEADLRAFVKYRSGSLPGAGDDTTALPGYVLAMISETVSERLAADIAREIDLRRWRAGNDFDFAGALYQVTLRGPHWTLFDHLLARIPDKIPRRLIDLSAATCGRWRSAGPTSARSHCICRSCCNALAASCRSFKASGKARRSSGSPAYSIFMPR